MQPRLLIGVAIIDRQGFNGANNDYVLAARSGW
jgi:hypothetical protein